MRFVSYRDGQSLRFGVIEAQSVVPVSVGTAGVGTDLGSALSAGIDIVAAGRAALASDTPRVPYASLTLVPPVPRPGKIICLGLNYADHAKEGGRDRPEYPWFFMRGATSLIATREPAIRPRVSERFDYEAELAVIIGQKAKHRTLENALDCVLGYSCFNDLSVRDYQKRTPQWTIGKNFDGTGAFGPSLVTRDELPRGASGLRIQSRVNGRVMQDADTSEMLWSVAETIVLLTECLTLEPGDVIAMGTPAGVGQAFEPPLWLKPGDKVEVEIDRVGVLINPVQAEA